MDFKVRRVAAFKKNLVELCELELKHANVSWSNWNSQLKCYHSFFLCSFRPIHSCLKRASLLWKRNSDNVGMLTHRGHSQHRRLLKQNEYVGFHSDLCCDGFYVVNCLIQTTIQLLLLYQILWFILFVLLIFILFFYFLARFQTYSMLEFPSIPKNKMKLL